MKKKIFVWCGYHLVAILKKVYGPDTVIVTTPSEGIDLFIFVSAKDILNKVVDPKEYKKCYGKPGAKAMTMSYEPSYLDAVKKGDFGIDFFYPRKFELETISKLPKESKAILRSYIFD